MFGYSSYPAIMVQPPTEPSWAEEERKIYSKGKILWIRLLVRNLHEKLQRNGGSLMYFQNFKVLSKLEVDHSFVLNTFLVRM